MSRNTCPLLEICQTNMARERRVGLTAIAKHYQTIHQASQIEWESLANDQPSFVSSDDFLASLDRRLLASDLRTLVVKEKLDDMLWKLDEALFSEWLDRDQLGRDEIDCEGPDEVESIELPGQKTLVCTSQRRIKRAEEYMKDSQGN